MIGDIFFEFKHLENELKKMLSAYHRNDMAIFLPPIDIVEKEGKIVVYVDLPGFKSEDISIEFEGKHLLLKGTKRIDKTGNKGLNFICLERKFGHFERRIYLGKEPDIEKTQAILSRGVLRINIPLLKESAEKVKIKIREEE